MAFLAAIPAWITVVGTVASAAVGVYSAVQQRNAGIENANHIKEQARTEASNAKESEINRRRNLLRALASQNASAGAAGIETGGSFGGIVRRQIDENQNDLLISDANTQSRQRNYAAAASNSQTAGNTAAAASLVDTLGKTYKSLK